MSAVETDVDPEVAEFLAAAAGVMSSTPADRALDDLGWWDALDASGGSDASLAAAAVFGAARVQGEVLANTPIVGALAARPHAAANEAAAGAIAAIARRSTDRGLAFVLLGDTGNRPVLVDLEGRGAFVLAADAVQRRATATAGGLGVAELDVATLADATPDIDEALAAPLRARSSYLARVAAAAEIAGASAAILAEATEYAGVREQFGQPIGSFQAVRHLLAWAATDCRAMDAVVERAVDLRGDPPPRFDEVTKALAGRNGRRVCDRTLQVFGGIGFTAEHRHHGFHSRVLALDAVLGTSAELTHALGRWLRTSGDDPMYPARLLAGVSR